MITSCQTIADLDTGHATICRHATTIFGVDWRLAAAGLVLILAAWLIALLAIYTMRKAMGDE